MERKGKFEDAQAFRRQLKIEETDEEEIEPEDDVQVPQDEMEKENHDISFAVQKTKTG